MPTRQQVFWKNYFSNSNKKSSVPNSKLLTHNLILLILNTLFVLWYKYDVYSKDSLGYILTAKIRLFIDMKDCDMIFCSISF